MTDNEIINIVDNLGVYKSKRLEYLTNHNPEILDEIYRRTKFLDDTNEKKQKIPFCERIYCIRNGLTERPKCIQCKINQVYFKFETGKYRDFCSCKCSKSSSQTKERRENTNFDRHGDKHYRNDEKIRVTRYKKNNGKWHADNYVQKVQNTLLRDHGDPHWNNPEKSTKTTREKYGVDFPLQSKEIQQKCRDTFKKNNPGLNSTMDMPELRKKLFIGTKQRSWNYIISDPSIKPNFTFDDFIKCDNPTEYDAFEFICTKCGNIFKSYWNNGHSMLCPHCHPELHGESRPELEISDYLRSIIKPNWTVLQGEHFNRQLIYPYEIDIIVKDDNDNIRLLIEYDGLFYHQTSDKFKDSKYHLSKTEMCEKLGYQLIHIFENEWLSEKDIVKSNISNLLGLSSSICLNNYLIKEIDTETANSFLSLNHIQGYSISSVNLGLIIDDKLVSVMSFSKSKLKSKYDWVLTRFCNIIGNSITDCENKLLGYFENIYNPRSIIAYVDRRWNNGIFYKKLGFKLDHISQPKYWYFNPHSPNKLYNKLYFQKCKLKSKLKIFDDSKSEYENMSLNGYLRIHDCGNLILVKEY